jgi:tetratricopeptide (TPR) repeat protein
VTPAFVEGLVRKFFASPRGKKPRSPLALAQEIADLAWETPQPQEQLDLARQALSVSPDCADAYVLLANQATSRDQARQLLEAGVAAGQRAMGAKTFEASTGRFWLDLRTRPYMRARLGLAQCLWESGQRAQAVEHYAEMLRLNPNDNQGVRYLLLGALVDLDRDEEAQRLMQRFEQDGSTEWAYMTALLAFRREGDSVISQALLLGAVKVNPYVPYYLVGNQPMPSTPPSYVSSGGEDEAVSYAAQFLRTWRSSPGATAWLRKTLKVPLPHPPKPRKPTWSLFRHTFLRLPQIGEEVWQLDVCRLPLL